LADVISTEKDEKVGGSLKDLKTGFDDDVKMLIYGN